MKLLSIVLVNLLLSLSAYAVSATDPNEAKVREILGSGTPDCRQAKKIFNQLSDVAITWIPASMWEYSVSGKMRNGTEVQLRLREWSYDNMSGTGGGVMGSQKSYSCSPDDGADD
jgi:hypothetical protein